MKKENRDKKLEIKGKLTEEFKIDEEVADKLVEDYGINVISEILDKPYILSHYLIPLQIVKKIIQKNSANKNENYKNRNVVAATMIHVIEAMTGFEGHIFSYKSEIEYKFKELDEVVDKEKLEETLIFLETDSEIVRERDKEGRECIYLSRLYKAEVELANVIGCLSKRNKCSNDEIENTKKVEEFICCYNNSSFKLNNSQINAVVTALNNRISIISGLAGTGKTTVIKTIVEGFKYVLSLRNLKINLVSYTGKSVDVLTKKTGIQGTTIHRFLGVGLYYKQEIRNIEADVIIIDESGLIGIELMNLLMCSIKENPNIRIVIVGDPFQLQSIEPGCVLKELLKSGGIPVAELSEVVRQKDDSLITNNAHKIIKSIAINGKKSGIWLKKNEFEFVEAESEQINRKVINKIDRLLSSGTSIYDIQVMSPVKKGINGVEELNREIADRFNNISDRDIYRFGILDPVIAVNNNYSKDIFNGQRGVVKRVEKSLNRIELITVNFGVKEISFKENEIQDIQISYVSTIHKMQGSESKVAIIVIDKEHGRMLFRELIYVSITRGIERVILIGDKEAFNEGIKRVSRERNSLLAERIEVRVNGENSKTA
ncbi:AAA family ATPase [Clostridium pasteurianum]|uniref:ATP-dependent DNA helicase n=1 Tax=Clostridium pasteurianum TaxID=1501 RepID=UPI0022609E09|nr:AAA family ATPase [Clostridium pasteurianum]UZW12866.1 AAA family ATPase [Clostridium pasteurianum]